MNFVMSEYPGDDDFGYCSLEGTLIFRNYGMDKDSRFADEAITTKRMFGNCKQTLD